MPVVFGSVDALCCVLCIRCCVTYILLPTWILCLCSLPAEIALIAILSIPGGRQLSRRGILGARQHRDSGQLSGML